MKWANTCVHWSAWWIKGQGRERESGVRAEVLTHYLTEPTVKQSVQKNFILCGIGTRASGRPTNIMYITFNNETFVMQYKTHQIMLRVYWQRKRKETYSNLMSKLYGLAVAAQKNGSTRCSVSNPLCNKTSTDPQDITYQVSVVNSIIMLVLHMLQPIVSSGVNVLQREVKIGLHWITTLQYPRLFL